MIYWNALRENVSKFCLFKANGLPWIHFKLIITAVGQITKQVPADAKDSTEDGSVDGV